MGWFSKLKGIQIGSHVVASTTNLELPGGTLHSGIVTGSTDSHWRVMFDEPNRHNGYTRIEEWIHKWSVSKIKSLKES